VERDGFGLHNWLKAVGGIGFFVAGVLPWWELTFTDGLSETTNAFSYDMTGLVPYVIFVGIAILTIIIETDSLGLPRVLVNPVLTLLAALAGTVLVGIRFFMDGYDNGLLEGEGNSITRGIGLYLAAAFALVVLAGSVLGYRQRHERGDDVELDEDDDEEAEMQRYVAERAKARRHANHPPLP
jgi:hypothetical protein